MDAQIKVTGYKLVLERINTKLAFWKKVPLPPGSLHLAVDRDIVLRDTVAVQLQAAITKVQGSAVSFATTTILEEKVAAILNDGWVAGEIGFDRDLWKAEEGDMLLHGQPEYFSQKGGH